MPSLKQVCALLIAFAIGSSVSAQAETYKHLSEALANPEKATRLDLGAVYQEDAAEPVEENNPDFSLKLLPEAFGSLTNLKELNIGGLEALEELPKELGNLKNLESIVIDNGNGYQMNVSLPETIAGLEKLKILRLYGAFDASGIMENEKGEPVKAKKLPQALGALQNLEELDIGRNGLNEVPPQVASLAKLVTLNLDYNGIKELPEFVGNLKNLKNLTINCNGGTRLPDSLKNLKGLNIAMGNAALKLKDQEELRKRFPGAVFDFSSEFDDETANEMPPESPVENQKN